MGFFKLNILFIGSYSIIIIIKIQKNCKPLVHSSTTSIVPERMERESIDDDVYII